MTTTTTRRSSTSSIIAAGLLLLGLSAFLIVPISCNPEPEETSQKEAAQTNADADREILLNVGIQDETEDRSFPNRFLIETPSGARWAPEDLEAGSGSKAFEKHPVGETRTLRLYPEGEEGRTLEVPITMKPEMSSVLAGSRTNIYVYDDSVVVTGPAVPDEKEVFDRPLSESP